MVEWIVEVDLVEDWLVGLDQPTFDLVTAAIRHLMVEGPNLRRPLVGAIAGSTIKNLKELRPGSAGRSEVRILFVFDPARKAILLVAGDKSRDWRGWYRKNIPAAEQRYATHLERLSKEGNSDG